MNPQAEEIHGGVDYQEFRELGLHPKDVIDFSSNIMPFGPSPEVVRSLHELVIDRYPDRDGYELRSALAQYHGMSVSQIMLGNGCSQLIHLTAMCWIKPGMNVIVLGPTFSEYARASKIAGGVCTEVSVFNSMSDSPTDAFLEHIQSHSPDVVWLCNPNNPTGHYLDAGELGNLIEAMPQIKFIVDESYLDFVLNGASLFCRYFPNLIVLRSMTKYYAMAGLRLGYLSCTESTMKQLMERRVPWSVNGAALVAGTAALNSLTYYRDSMEKLRQANKSLTQALKRIGLQPKDSSVPFFLVPVDNGKRTREQLLKKRILVRDCRSFGLENMIRISTQTDTLNE
ncbi:MAG: pyridoxal phosphate-dependent aminotransferase, partial [Pirellula sp.]